MSAWPLLLLLALAHDPIELRVSPSVCAAPCSVRALVRIEPHPLNRWWALQIDGTLFSSGIYQLDGADSAIQQAPIWFHTLPAGEYAVTAVVYRAQRRSEAGRASRQVIVS